MPTLLSPGVAIVERDFSNIIPTVSSGIGAIAGRFTKGPINTPILISSEDELVSVFGKPNDTNSNEWFCASQFLQYTNKLWVVRSSGAGVLNATSGTAGYAVLNDTSYSIVDLAAVATATTNANWIARNPGTAGNGLGVIMLDANNFTDFSTWATTNAAMFPNKVPLSNYVSYTPSTSQFASSIKSNAADEMHVLVIDFDGSITGTRYTILEYYEGLSKASNAVNYKGDPLYYVAAINNASKYIWWAAHPTGTDIEGTGVDFGGAVSSSLAFKSLSNEAGVAGPSGSSATKFYFKGFLGGTQGTASTEAEVKTAYDQLKNTDLYDINLILTGAFNLGATPGTIASYVVSNIAVTRKDSIAFISAYATGGAPILDNASNSDSAMSQAIIDFKNNMNLAETDASYAVVDTGFKYMYDRYNNKYRWVPLNGDVAGICARTDDIADPWYSPGGFNRGGVKNVVKLAYNPNQAQRDYLYPKGINPVVSFPGQGVVLFGDRTATMKPSAFDRINVRRLFLILEKAISIAAKYQLFEFNDGFTRAQFRNMVEPYLRNIQGRRGIIDFKVVCDESNNTGQVIDSNQFVADIFVKPNRSINFITLNFVATRTDVSFSTVVNG